MSVRFLSGVNIDSNTLFVDDANNRVGIGTGSPVSSLNINNGDAWINVTDTLRGLQFGYAGPSHGSYRAAVMGGAESYGGTDSGMLTFHTQNGYVVSAIPPERMRITSSGNVGIGITSASERLTVVSSGAGVSAARFTDANRADIVLSFPSNGVASIDSYQGASDGALAFRTAANERMRITSTGNVGIGTTSPQSKLQIGTTNFSIADRTSAVYGAAASETIFTVGISGVDYPQLLNFGVNQVGLYSTISARQFTVATENKLVLQPNGGNVGIGTTAPGAKLEVNGDAWFTNGGNLNAVITQGAAGKGRLYLYDGGNATIALQTNGASYLNAGNVGIGTTSPTSIGTGITSLDIQGSNAGGIAFGPSGTKNYIYGASTMYVEAHTTAVFSTSGTEKMRLTTGGQLIVGGTTVGYAGTKLQVGNTSDSQNGLNILTSTTGYGYILFGDGAGADTYVGQIWYYHGDNYMGFQTNGSEKLRITSAGNVGIGTTSTFGRLQISGTVVNPDLSSATATGVSLVISNSDTGYGTMFATYGNGNGALQQRRTNTNTYYDFLLQPHGGNVGIGTSSPVVKLQVDGTITSTGVLTAYTSVPSINIGHNGDSAFIAATSGSGANTPISFSVGNNNEKMRITADGNVGIGTTAPGAKLEIAQNTDNTDGPTLRIANNANTLSNGQLIGAIDFYNGDDSGTGNAVGAFIRSFTADAVLPVSSQYLSFAAGGTTERMRIASTGATRLNAYGSGSFTGTVAYNLAVDSSGNIIETAGGVVDGSGTANYVSKWSDANTLTDSQLFDNGTNVGIGTSSPANTLQIGSVGATGYSGNRLAVGDGTNVVALHPGAVSYLTANGDIVIGAGGNTTNQVYVKSGGNVGIGTTSPAGKLHIADDGPNALIIGDTQVSTIGETNNGGYPGMKIVPYNSNIHIGISSTTDNKINLWYGGQNYTYWQQLETYSVISNYSTSALVLQVNGGNVGIGTTSPSFRFDVAGAAGDWATRFTSNAGASAYFAHGGGYGGYIDAGSNATSSTYLLSLVSNGSTRVYIKGNGDVGIGTTSSINNSLLSVGGGINTTTGIIGYNTADWFTLNGKTQPHYGFNLIPTSSSPIGISGYFGISLATEGSERIRILGNGNVGIGTTSPATKLHVVGYSRNDGGLLLNGSDADYREIIFTTSAASRWNLYAYGGESGSNAGSVLYLARYADNGDYIANVATFLRTNGYVGIATTTPTQQLHVSGNIRVTGAYYDSNNSAGSSGQVLSSTGSGTDWVSLSEITGVDGTGTANYIAKWSDTDTITNSSITDNGSTVTANVDRLNMNKQAGIYTFSKTLGATVASDFFSISNSHGAQAFRVTFVCSSSGYSVAKTYEVVHAYGQTPIYFKVVDTGPYGSEDFDVAFTDSNSSTGVKATVTNNSATTAGNIVATVFLGGGFETITVTAL